MNSTIRDYIFFLLCFSLIFDNIPKPIQLNFLGGEVGNKLVIYPLLTGAIYSAYCHYKYRDIFVHIEWFKRYIAVFIAVIALSTITGLVFFPYYDLVFSGPANQFEKLPRILDFLHLHGIYINQKTMMQLWIILRQLKGIVVESFWCFGGAYMIYCWYKNDWHRAVNIMVRGISVSFIVLFFYALVEISYLGGSLRAADVLKSINPYIHTIVTNHEWWPPLLWKNQLRLVFPEPSHVGNFIGIGLPIIWYMYFSQKGWALTFALAIHTVMSFLIFMTKARTAWGMLAGMMVLLLCLIVWGKRYALLKKFVVLTVCIWIGFIGFLQFENYSLSTSTHSEQVVAVQAIENNFTSLASSNKRSNGARYALLKAYLRTGIEHPFFGVGIGLASAYVRDHFTAKESENSEIALWIHYQDTHGPLAYGYSIPDAMNEFVNRFCTTGAFGVIVFFFPFAYITILLLKKWRRDSELTSMFVVLALVSSVVAGCNGGVNILYAVWILLGVSYAIIFGRNEKGNT